MKMIDALRRERGDRNLDALVAIWKALCDPNVLSVPFALAALLATSTSAEWGTWRPRIGEVSCVLENTYYNVTSSSDTSPVNIVYLAFAQGIPGADVPPELVELGYASQQLLMFVQFSPAVLSPTNTVGATIDNAAMDVIEIDDRTYFHLDPKRAGDIMSALSADARVVVTATDDSGAEYDIVLPSKSFSTYRAMFETCNAAAVS